jgi:hypothetical protein
MACYEQWCSRCKRWTRHCDAVCVCGQLEEVSLIDAQEERDTYKEEEAIERETRIRMGSG